MSKTVEPLFLVENEYRLAIVEAERQFVEGLLRRIADDEAYTRAWKGFHQAGRNQGQFRFVTREPRRTSPRPQEAILATLKESDS